MMTPETPSLFHSSVDPILYLLGLPPERVWHSLGMLAFLLACTYLVRTAYMMAATRSVIVNVVVTTLTILPGALLGAILLWAGYQHPDRTKLNLLFALGLYVAWAAGGALSRVVRSDTEGADIGWLSHAAVLTFVPGVIAVIVFG